ncbi:MAG TPA: aminotransferase class V-fold PLP-dependent enzyme [Gaiella sp.]
MTFEEVRAGFPVLQRVAYLNAGTFGPLARATVDAMQAEQERDLAHGRVGLATVERVLALRQDVRERIARLVGVEPGTVALTASTTDGCNIVLAGLGLEPGDEVITTTDEHFGLLGPLGVSPAAVIVVEPDPEHILAAVTPRTRLIAVSHVLWTTGAILPVRELRERSGVPVLADGAQSAGAMPVDATGVDFYTVSGQKWLCGPDTTGALVVADPERLRIAFPSYFAQASFEPDGAFVPREGAVRFERNWIAPASLTGLATAVDQRPAWAFERAFATAERCRELLGEHVEVITPAERATLVAFRPPEGVEAADLVARLQAADVQVRELPGRRLVRASVGYWTSDDDLTRLASGVHATG